MNTVNDYITEYRESHDNDTPKFLWQLKLSKDEFEDLQTRLRSCISGDDFSSAEKELVLYISEWWRREYDGGSPSYEAIAKSLGCISKKTIKDACISGFEALNRLYKFQIIRTTGDKRSKRDWFASARYQGGLPMNYIVKNIARQGSGWGQFFRNLAWKGQDYSVLKEKDHRKTLVLSDSIRAFCEQLQVAADPAQSLDPIGLLPFQSNPKWWGVIKKEINKGRKEHRERNPFDLAWEIVMDDRAQTFCLKFCITGPRTLSEQFRINHNLKGRTSTSISVRVNDTIYPLAEYDYRFYSRRNVGIQRTCMVGDTISLCIEDTGENLWCKQLLFSEPKLLSLTDIPTNTYRLCSSSELLSKDCRVLATTNWGHSAHKPVTYTESKTRSSFAVFNFFHPTDEILLDNGSQKYVFHPDSKIESAEIDSGCAIHTRVPVRELIFNAQSVRFIEYRDGKAVEIDNARINLQCKQQGRISAEIKNMNGTIEFVRFLNVGNLEIECKDSSKSSCRIAITWPHGDVTSDEAVASNVSNVGVTIWDINKASLVDKRYAKFTFTPQFGNEFTLQVILPFYGFCIYDRTGKEIKAGDIIPISDLNSYRYYMKQKETLKLYPNISEEVWKRPYELHKYEGLQYTYKSNCVERKYFNDPKRCATVPSEGCLSSMFMDGSDLIYSQMMKVVDSLPDARVTMKMKYGNTQEEYTFQDFPYRLEFANGGIRIKTNTKLPRYDGYLLAIPLMSPTQAPIEIKEGSQEMYDLTEIKNQNPDEKWIIYGNLRGYVLPLLVDLGCAMSDDNQRGPNRKKCLEDVAAKLTNAVCFDDIWMRAISWFDILSNGQIPGTSILELVAISEDRVLLSKFALQYALYSNLRKVNEETIKSQLLDFQRQMSFSWEWSEEINCKAKDFIFEQTGTLIEKLKSQYSDWVDEEKDEDPNLSDYYQNVPNHFDEFIESFVQKFSTFYSQLKEGCAPQKVYHDPATNAYEETDYEGVPSEEAQDAFRYLRQYISGNPTPNERWILERELFNEILKKKNLSDFLDEQRIDHNEKIRREIRKSILYGLKFKND